MTDISTTYLDSDADQIKLARPALLESVQRVNREPVNVKDYGALGDGSTNDTTAFNNAFTFCASSGRSLRIPAGRYRISNVTFSGSSFQFEVRGDGSGVTTLVNDIDTNPTLVINGMNQVTVRGLTITGNGTLYNWGEGTAATNNILGTRATSAAALRMIDCVHSLVDECYLENALIGAEVRGGVAINFTNCQARWNDQAGWKIWRTGGSGYPNLVTLRDSHPKENGQCGVYFDNGRMLLIDGADIEGNGKNTTVATSIAAGVYVGISTGEENGATAGPNGGAYHTQAVAIRNSWFEQNGHNNGSGAPSGTYTAQVLHNHGILLVDNCTFTNTTSGRYFRINGGQYTIERCSSESALPSSTLYVDEGSTSGNANLCYPNFVQQLRHNTTGTYSERTASNAVIDTSKTTFGYTRFVPTLVQTGSTTTSSGTASVTFPTAYGSAPGVVAVVNTNDGGQTTYTCEVYSVTTSGFTCRVKSRNSGGTVTTNGAYTFTWISTGT